MGVMADVILMSDRKVYAVPIAECGEALVDVREHGGLLHDPGPAHPHARLHAHLRAGLLERVLTAQTLLPAGLRLVFVEGYRPPAVQQQIFEDYSAELRHAHPDWSQEQVHAAASRHIAPPDNAPHCAGAAVDLTLASTHGGEVDMGCALNATPEESHNACYTNATTISAEATVNRRTLAEALTRAGLINYPTEWWHWSYGDRYWALLTRAPNAIYGPVRHGP